MTAFRSILAALVAFFAIGTMAPALAEETVLTTGTFEGRSDHVVTGAVTIYEKEGRTYVRLESDFVLDGAPDPKLGFGNDGLYDHGAQFSKLDKRTGLQEYVLPAGVDSAAYNELYVWCERFSLPLGVAAING